MATNSTCAWFDQSQIKSLTPRDLAFYLHSRFVPSLDTYEPPASCVNFLHHNSQSAVRKLDSYNSMQYIRQYHVVSLNETWFNNKLPNSLVKIDGFSVYRHDRNTAYKATGGGAALYINNNIEHEHLPKYNPLGNASFDAVWAKLKIGKLKTIIVGSLYAPNSCDSEVIDYLSSILSDKSFDCSNLVLMGDFNVNWNTNSHTKSNLTSISESNNLSQAISGCTYVSSQRGRESLLDLAFVSNTLKIHASSVLVSQLSDHYAITTSISAKVPRQPRKIVSSRNFNSALSTLENIPCNASLIEEIIKNNKQPDTQAQLLDDWVQSVVDTNIPVKNYRVRSDTPNWLSSELKRLVSLKNRFFRRITHSLTTPNQWLHYKKFRNFVQSKIKAHKKEYYYQKLSRDQRSFFSEANKLLGRASPEQSHPTSLNYEGKLISEESDIADILNNFFTSIDSPAARFTQELSNRTSAPSFSFLKVSADLVKKILLSLKSNKRGGVEQLPTSVYKALSKTVVPALTHIINSGISTSCFPSLYKIALVTPVYKKGCRLNPGNYRPISSLPILSKVFEKVLNCQIVNHLNSHGLLSARQFGFRNHVSSEQMLLRILDSFYSVLDSKTNKYIAVLSLDIKKAFDTVDHRLLVHKLSSQFGFSKSSVELMKSYLADRSQLMKIGITRSSPASITKGVPQGSILGPLLFNLMVDDMLVSHTDTFSYADDTLTYALGRTQEQALDLVETRFSMLSTWYKNNGLGLCVEKTNCLVISNCPIDYDKNISLMSHIIPIKKSIVQLGVILDSKLDFREHIQIVSNKCSSMIFALRKIRHLLTCEQAKDIYTSIIRPKIEYCSCILQELPDISSNKLELIQNRAIRVICKAPKIFSVTDGRLCLNLDTLCSRRAVSFRNLVGKTMCGMASDELYNLLSQAPTHSRSLRSRCSYILPCSNTNFGKKRFTYCAIKYLSNRDRETTELPTSSP